MKNLTVLTSLALVISTSCAFAQEDKTPTTDQEKTSYAIGINMGSSLRDSDIAVDSDLVLQGLIDGLEGTDPKMTEEEIIATLTAFQQQIVAKQQEKQHMAAGENVAAGVAFLAENGKREGVVTTESGLQYEIVEAGDGAMPTATDSVTVHYTGTLIDGTKFDSSVDRGAPATFGVGQVIPGWTEALKLMPVGSKWKLYIPSSLAYGDRAGGPIPPGSTLIFDVELLEIK
ncbi:MAG: FKBP-type peptidyl-prolyl cis-trans isomerase [Thermoanaerobaculia bacterium]|nr:FKBP-type peptidyl-prolyl cis-trans isomerase [Thermoanaerobaculia bacterium]